MKKEIPILFSTPMVQALLAGRKTQTRRLLKLKHYHDHNWTPTKIKEEHIDGIQRWEMRCGSQYTLPIFKCPYGQPGDLLWVRESWQMIGWNFEDGEMTVRFKDGWLDCMAPEDDEWMLNYIEHLEKIGCLQKDPDDEERFVFTDKRQPWKPSIHMPKNAARIWLET